MLLLLKRCESWLWERMFHWNSHQCHGDGSYPHKDERSPGEMETVMYKTWSFHKSLLPIKPRPSSKCFDVFMSHQCKWTFTSHESAHWLIQMKLSICWVFTTVLLWFSKDISWSFLTTFWHFWKQNHHKWLSYPMDSMQFNIELTLHVVEIKTWNTNI